MSVKRNELGEGTDYEDGLGRLRPVSVGPRLGVGGMEVGVG